MARERQLADDDEDFKRSLSRSFQSAHIHVLLGSGASCPAIPAANNVENEIAELRERAEHEAADKKLCELLTTIQDPINNLLAGTPNASCGAVLAEYVTFLRSIERILVERRSGILPRQATVFTTNYDLFAEMAAHACSMLEVNTGFSRSRTLGGKPEFTSRAFFLSLYDTGNLYDYEVELPTLNIVKLHGCMSWQRDVNGIVRHVAPKTLLADTTDPAAVRAFVDDYAVVLPQITKFNATVLDTIYYDLLRLYANQLDKENVLLIAFGFSFRDEHIRDITIRALKNPTLRLIVFAHNEHDRDNFLRMFDKNNNVEVVSPPAGEVIDFARLNGVLQSVIPTAFTDQP